MAWTVILLSKVAEGFEGLDPVTAVGVAAALDLPKECGPALGRPLVDTLQRAFLPNINELQPGSGASEVRLLFAFDPGRQAILLAA